MLSVCSAVHFSSWLMDIYQLKSGADSIYIMLRSPAPPELIKSLQQGVT
jgi:hypothetical protein